MHADAELAEPAFWMNFTIAGMLFLTVIGWNLKL
jgi:hypothetical protein